MKRFNQVIFLLSYCIFGTVCAMEKEIVPTQEYKWFVTIDSKAIAKINKFAYGLEYDAQHKASRLCDGTISFPVEYTDPLPIEYYGEKRFFSTFGDGMEPLDDRGDVLTILDPEIKQLVIVHGTRHKIYDNRVRESIHVYLGLKTDKAILIPEKCEKIYPAKVMSLQVVSEGENGYKYHSAAKFEIKRVNYFGDEDMLEEVKKQFPEIKNRDWNDVVVRSLMRRLLGPNARHFNFECGVFTQSYWDKKNALKEIAYSSEEK